MQSRAVTLRLARTADATAMSAMARDLIETGLGWHYLPERVARLIEDHDTASLVACDAAGVQGYAVMQFGDERAHLVVLCVRTSRQRLGIGRRLLEWLLASARVAGIASIHLELRADNLSALAFYRALGFVETRIVPGYYDGRIAARRMERLLRAPSAAD